MTEEGGAEAGGYGEEAAQEIQHWLHHHLFDQVPVGICVIDRTYRIVDANPRFQTIFGPWHGKRCYEVCKGRETPCLQCGASLTFQDGRTRTREEEGVLEGGRPLDYLVHLVPIRGPLGQIRFIVEMFTDITEVKRLEREKREAERLAAVGETVSGIAHGIKNVLMGLEGGMYAVNTGIRMGDDERIARGWMTLEENVNRISTFVKEFLDFAKGREARVAPTDPNLPARQVVELYREKAAKEGIQLEMDLAEDLGTVPLDLEGIHTCLANLVSNALDACLVAEKEGPFRVVVRTRREGGDLVYEVEDNGQGMDYEISKKVFSKFFTTKGSDRGTGLGLLTTKRIVHQHGGSISFESKEGEGSVFRIRLPLVGPGNLGPEENEGATTADLAARSEAP